MGHAQEDSGDCRTLILTVFRKLRELDYCTSYSHRGRFYTLRELAEFDENGVVVELRTSVVLFKCRGTLVATARRTGERLRGLARSGGGQLDVHC